MTMAADWWLIKTMFVIDLAVTVLVWIALHNTFPRRVRKAIKRNGIRLDGSASPRRKAIEKEAQFRWLGNVLFVGMASLLLVNVALFAFHHYVMPFPIALSALEQFDPDVDVWRTNISDPERGNVAQTFKDWQHTQERGDASDRLARLMPMYFVWWGLGLMAIIGMMAMLARTYVRSLVNLEEQANRRHQAYLMYDMEQRFDSVEQQEEPVAGHS